VAGPEDVVMTTIHPVRRRWQTLARLLLRLDLADPRWPLILRIPPPGLSCWPTPAPWGPGGGGGPGCAQNFMPGP